jgi:hypothetical protein
MAAPLPCSNDFHDSALFLDHCLDCRQSESFAAPGMATSMQMSKLIVSGSYSPNLSEDQRQCTVCANIGDVLPA